MALSAEKTPPLLPITARPVRQGPSPTLLLAAVPAAILIARISEYLPFPLVRCTFKMMTGLPCAFCGGTRSLRSLSHLHFAEAFYWNPLVFIGSFLFPIGALFYWALPDDAQKSLLSIPWLKIAIPFVVANWIYLIIFLPA